MSTDAKEAGAKDAKSEAPPLASLVMAGRNQTEAEKITDCRSQTAVTVQKNCRGIGRRIPKRAVLIKGRQRDLLADAGAVHKAKQRQPASSGHKPRQSIRYGGSDLPAGDGDRFPPDVATVDQVIGHNFLADNRPVRTDADMRSVSDVDLGAKQSRDRLAYEAAAIQAGIIAGQDVGSPGWS